MSTTNKTSQDSETWKSLKISQFNRDYLCPAKIDHKTFVDNRRS